MFKKFPVNSWHAVPVQRLPQLWCRRSSSYSHLLSQLTARQLPLLYDDIGPLPSYLLSVTLADFLPPSAIPLPQRLPLASTSTQNVPPSHHLVYFPPPSRLSALLPDDTDPDQSPGEPFVRRMWAGGRINFHPNRTASLSMVGKRAACLERISNVVIKGPSDNEKIFVTIERRISKVQHTADKPGVSANMPESEQRRDLPSDDNCSVIEQRDLVFMRERTPEAAADAAKAPGKVVKPQHEPDFYHTLTPTAALLFRFSALTFNAHRIHLDKRYCQEVEGHRNLLVHGPLSLVLMVELLRRHLSTLGVHQDEGRPLTLTEDITEIEYRNLAPLYAEEEMRVCGRARGDGSYDLWIEGRDGGYAVKGIAKTRQVSSPEDEGEVQRRARGRKRTPEEIEKLTLAAVDYYRYHDSKPEASELASLTKGNELETTVRNFVPYLYEVWQNRPKVPSNRTLRPGAPSLQRLRQPEIKAKAVANFVHYVYDLHGKQGSEFIEEDDALDRYVLAEEIQSQAVKDALSTNRMHELTDSQHEDRVDGEPNPEIHLEEMIQDDIEDQSNDTTLESGDLQDSADPQDETSTPPVIDYRRVKED
jgi:hydroxyacyl-ACP dehydratase HTD2-like protein with hotdog domain